MKDLPGRMLALTVCSYWTCVVLLAVLKRLRHQLGAGLFPQKPKERLMWAVWVPVILLWNILPWTAMNNEQAPLGVPVFVRTLPGLTGLRAAAAACGLACFLLTMHCWLKMGRNWNIAVVTQRSHSLLQTGIYGFIRHPIYALSIILMLCTAVVAPTALMLAVAVLHLIMLILKARSEEESLLEAHGNAYQEYAGRTGRFFPPFIHLGRKRRGAVKCMSVRGRQTLPKGDG
jgi:protein-S-isoprenylcysteine O-methyltransferase Ste14